MVIGTYLTECVFKPRRERLRAEAWEEGYAEGYAKGLAKVYAKRAKRRKTIIARLWMWNRRRLDAEARDEPFDKPFPLSEDDVLFLGYTNADGKIRCQK